MLWANIHLLFWLSLVPFVTRWMGENHFTAAPSALDGVVLLMAAIAYWVLQGTIIASQGDDSLLKAAVGRDWKGKLSPILYLIAIPTAFLSQWISGGIACSQQDLQIALAAGWAGGVVPGHGDVAAGTAAHAGGAKHRHQFVMAAGLAVPLVVLQIATGAAHVLWRPFDVWPGPIFPGIQAHGLAAPAEPGVVDLVQAVRQLAAGRR
jgi:hypothetical protein